MLPRHGISFLSSTEVEGSVQMNAGRMKNEQNGSKCLGGWPHVFLCAARDRAVIIGVASCHKGQPEQAQWNAPKG